MPVPNEDQVGSYLDQSELDTGDWTMLENVHQGYSVISGGTVTAQGSPNGTVAVAAGVAKVGHVAVSITAGSVSVISGSANPDGTTATAADATLARFSLVTINSSGQLGVLHGTPAGLGPTNDGSYLSAFPTFASKTVLAAVWVPPTATTVTTTQITDKREIRTDGDFVARPITPTALSAGANDYNPTGLSTANVIRQATSNTTIRGITGLVPTGHTDGKILWFQNLGPGAILLDDENTSSAAANRFAPGGDIVLPPDRSVALRYDATALRWRAIGGATPATTNTIALGAAAVSGTSPYFLRADDTIAAFDATAPSTQAFGDAAATGAAAVAARRDHKHGMPAGTIGPSGLRVGDDFFYGTGGITASGTNIGFCQARVSGTAATLTVNGMAAVPNHPGIIQLATGTTTTGAAELIAGNTTISLGGGRARYGAWIYLPALSVVAQRFEVMCGFTDNVSDATAVDGCFFTYRDDVSANWTVTNVANSVNTATHQVSTGIAVAATTWYLLEVEVNAAGTNVDFLINGTVTNTLTTNIPTGAGRETGFQTGIIKSLGTTAALLNVDGHYLQLDFSSTR